MVKVEVDLPIQLYGFLEAAAKFSKMEPEEYIREYVVESVVRSVESDVDSISDCDLWDKKTLKTGYGLDEVEAGL